MDAKVKTRYRKVYWVLMFVFFPVVLVFSLFFGQPREGEGHISLVWRMWLECYRGE